jgi:hypothetical protein
MNFGNLCRTALLGLVGIGFLSASTAAQTFVTLDYPGAQNTQITDIEGNIILGSDYDVGFLYNGSTFTPISHPLGAIGTFPQDMYGGDIVGIYGDSSGAYHGFIYDGTTYSTLDHPSADFSQYHGSRLLGICGNDIVGYYQDSSGTSHGFLYNRLTSAFANINHPLASSGGEQTGTAPTGISGGKIVGTYFDAGEKGFLYDGTTFTTIDGPAGNTWTSLTGIDGQNIVGISSLGTFIYDSSTYKMLEYPSANSTQIYGISGDQVVGAYWISGNTHGFIATVPEPSTLALLAIGVLGLIGYWRRPWSSKA